MAAWWLVWSWRVLLSPFARSGHWGPESHCHSTFLPLSLKAGSPHRCLLAPDRLLPSLIPQPQEPGPSYWGSKALSYQTQRNKIQFKIICTCCFLPFTLKRHLSLTWARGEGANSWLVFIFVLCWPLCLHTWVQRVHCSQTVRSLRANTESLHSLHSTNRVSWARQSFAESITMKILRHISVLRYKQLRAWTPVWKCLCWKVTASRTDSHSTRYWLRELWLVLFEAYCFIAKAWRIFLSKVLEKNLGLLLVYITENHFKKRVGFVDKDRTRNNQNTKPPVLSQN